VCVCVSVCPSHFLSTRLQVRPLNRFFTVDSLTDADLCKDVPFGVLIMNSHIYGSKVRQNPHFGGLNRHFKPNMRKIQIAISVDLYQIDMKFDMQLRPATETSWVVSYGGKQFQDGGRPPF